MGGPERRESFRLCLNSAAVAAARAGQARPGQSARVCVYVSHAPLVACLAARSSQVFVDRRPPRIHTTSLQPAERRRQFPAVLLSVDRCSMTVKSSLAAAGGSVVARL